MGKSSTPSVIKVQISETNINTVNIEADGIKIIFKAHLARKYKEKDKGLISTQNFTSYIQKEEPKPFEENQ